MKLGFLCDIAYSPIACTYVYEYADFVNTKKMFTYNTMALKKLLNSSFNFGNIVHIENLAFKCRIDNQGSFQRET